MTTSYLLSLRRGVLLPLCLLSLLSVVGVRGDMPSLDELLIVPNFKLSHPIERFESNSIEWRWLHPHSHTQQQANVNYQDRTLDQRTAEGSLAFQLSTPNSRIKSQLLTFDEHAEVGKVRSILGSALFEDQLADKAHATTQTHINCQFRDQQGQVYDDDTIVMGELLTKHILEHGKNSLQLECVESSTPISHRSNPSRRGHIATMATSHVAGKTGASHVKKTSHIFNFLQFVEKPYTGNEIHARNVLRRSITGELAEYPLESAELIAATWAGVWGWVSNWIKYHWGPIHDYPDYTNSTTQTGRWHLNTGEVLQPDSTFGAESDSRVRIAIAADWAAGTMESDFVQNVMMNGNGSQYKPEWTLHIGDIYYLGASEFVNSNCLGQPPAGVKRGVTWPHGSIGSFAVEGNHEMYSRGGGFFDDFLPTLGVTDPKTGKPQGQQAGYVSMENRYWRVILLDTGYNTYGPLPGLENKNNTQPEVIMDWLVNVVRISDPLDKRGIIFFSHHQVESAFQNEVSQATPNQIADVVPSSRQVLWLYGHEHRLAFYNMTVLPNDVRVLGRCIGNGGFPSTQAPIPARARESGLIAYDDRLYKLQPGIVFNQNLMFNGFVHMDLEGPQATFKYSTLAIDPTTNELSPTLQTDLVEEVFQIDNDGNVQLTSLLILNDGMTVISNH